MRPKPNSSSNASSEKVFLYPPDSFVTTKFRSIEEIKRFLKCDQSYPVEYKILKNNNSYYLNCTKCKSNISLTSNNNRMDIKVFQNEHNHANELHCIDDSNNESPRRKEEDSNSEVHEITKPFQKMKIKTSDKNVEESAIDNDSIHDKETTGTKQVSTKFDEITTLHEYFNELSKSGFDYKCIYEDEANTSMSGMLIFSRLMKKNYAQFGESINIELLEDKIHQNNQQQQNNKIFSKHIILISGYDSNLRRVVFGYGFVKDLETYTLEDLLLEFIRTIISNKCPQSIFTQYNETLNQAIYNLRKKGHFVGIHVFDSFSVLAELKKMKLPSKIFHLYAQALVTDTEEEFNRIVEEISSVCRNETEKCLLEDFIAKSSYTCMSKIPQRYVGFNISGCQIETLSDLLEQQFKSSIKMWQVTTWIQQYQDKVRHTKSQVVKIELQKYFNNSVLKSLRKRLETEIFKKFIKLYYESQQFEIREKSNNLYEVSKYKSEEKLVIRYNGVRYTCSCKMAIKTGLPCSHLIRFLEYRKISIDKFVNKRWLIEGHENTNMQYDQQLETIQEQEKIFGI